MFVERPKESKSHCYVAAASQRYVSSQSVSVPPLPRAATARVRTQEPDDSLFRIPLALPYEVLYFD